MDWWNTIKTTVTAIQNILITTAIGLVKVGAIALKSWAFVGTIIAVMAIAAVVKIIDQVITQKGLELDTPQEDLSSLAETGEFNYHASIHLNNVHFCSGAFIGTYFILTVAQCMHTFVNNQREISKMKVYVAVHEVPSYFRCSYAIDKITLHPDFNANRLDYNMAILKVWLTEKVTEPQYVQPIKLPSQRMKIENTFVIVSGFKSFDTPEVRTDLTKSNMTVIPQNICRSHFIKKISTSKKFCAIPSYRWKPCQTSRGGPAINTDKILIGLFIMENPIGCAKELPSIFLDVSFFIDFIKAETN
ncbi:serine protease 46-like [Phymastichus coffea]|uniref:serine protease 46-like n=1 Tax=Phymastichus coffea TaxID=108790 RepID=UPI00273BE295|nr:serine protease 46-like [Phymastichus coffea]